MFEEELVAFRAADENQEPDAAEKSQELFTFTKTCLKQNFFTCILDQLCDLTRNSARKRVKGASDSDGINSSDDEVNILTPIFNDIKSKDAES